MSPAEALEPPLPRFAQIEPVGRSPLRYGDAPALIGFDAFTRTLDQFPGLRSLQLQGVGEPLLHPRFFDMASYAAARGIEVSTNSGLPAMSARRAEQCVTSGLRRMNVFLDAAHAAGYDFGYRRALANLQRLTDAKRRLARDAPELRVVAAVMRSNLAQLPGLLRRLHELGVLEARLEHLPALLQDPGFPGRPAPARKFIEAESLALEPPERLEGTLAELSALAARLGLALRLPSSAGAPAAEPREHPCNWPWHGAYIGASGAATPCSRVPSPGQVSFGNMSREGVLAIWNGESYRAFRERLGSNEPPQVCRGCPIYQGKANEVP